MKGIARVLKRIVPTPGKGFKSSPRQIIEMLWLGAFYKLSPLEYRSFEFGRLGTSKQHIRSFLRVHDAEKRLRPTLNSRPWAPMLTNKLLFNSYFRQRQIPLAQVYGMFHPQFGSDTEGRPLCNEKDLKNLLDRKNVAEFVLKPIAGKTGLSVLVLTQVEKTPHDIVFADRAGTKYHLTDLVKHMSKKMPFIEQGFLLEEKLNNHQEIAIINPSAVNTCRLVTFMNKSGKVQLIFSVLRIGVEGKNTDNWHTGGLAAPINPVNGTIGEGLIRHDFPRGGWHSAHPDTGTVFKGRRIPYWDDIVALANKAATMTPFIRSIGWDIAVTPAGPVIIEANFSWGPMMCQACSGPLLTPEIREEFARFGLHFPR